jgi:hypothetical protein
METGITIGWTDTICGKGIEEWKNRDERNV